MKTALAAFLLLANLSVAAQYKAAAMKAPSASPLQKDLNRCLAELERVAVNTDSDIARLKTELPKSTWKTAWLSSRSRRQETHTADALQHNLENVVPAGIRDVQASRGSVAPAIKLYNDVNSTYELLDSLIGSTQNHAKNVDAAPLIADRTSMGRIRQNLSAYIQNASASMEAGSKSAANGQPVRKIVVDDNVPDKTAKK